MSYTTQQDILDFVEDNNVKFVRFAFCDIFGFQKNIAVLASDLPKALEDGVCFDGSAIAGFMHVEESDLLLRPDLSTMTILPWRTAEGRVMQFFCDVEKPDNTPFGGNCRAPQLSPQDAQSCEQFSSLILDSSPTLLHRPQLLPCLLGGSCCLTIFLGTTD